jgi:hypothetical protein
MKHTHRAAAFWALAVTDIILLKFWAVNSPSKWTLAALAAASVFLFIRDAVKI